MRQETSSLVPMIDFDDIDGWWPGLASRLESLVQPAVLVSLAESPPRFIEDACRMFLDSTNRDAVVDTALDWIGGNALVAYHGTRLNDEDCDSVRLRGLLPLRAGDRTLRLDRALRSHPEWDVLSSKLGEVVNRVGPGCRVGRREGQVHLTLSRSGLEHSFNHYLQYGSEFDQNVVQLLIGNDGLKYLAKDGQPRLIRVVVPGKDALSAAHPHFTVEDLRERGEVPTIAREFLQAFSYRIAHPTFQSRTLKEDCGMVFRCAVPPEWIDDIVSV